MNGIFVDWNRGKGNFKSRLVLVLFRTNKIAKINKAFFLLMIPYLIFYRFLVEWLLSIELPWKTEIGSGLVIHHGHALVVNDKCVIGKNVSLRQCTTIGSKKLIDGSNSKCPVIGNNVDIGCNVCIIGPVHIGDNVVIGAGSIVIKDVPENCVVAGNPARIIRRIGELNTLSVDTNRLKFNI